MTQGQALQLLAEILGRSTFKEATVCSGDYKTCADGECMVCGVRDCPGNEPLHYHHDGCPYCYHHVDGYR